MPIVALSESAARAISSTLVLNDAISVIKELIDNALDSKATNITIEISANTLDIIQVKDNGGGIGVEDRQLLCKRGFTSKIRTFEDLSQLGGKFLGFRGEALASIAELSDGVTFTTRIGGETVGTSLKFNSKGKLISSSSAAHGTGTTVRVSDFLKSIPVRKQTALKQATKTLSSIKKLLFDYAFARPTVRFQFKVLKSWGDSKANWSFAPCADASNLNVLASKIVGKDVAAQCKQFTACSDDGGYIADALIFAQDLDISKCGGTDRFVSIDGRPLAVEQGLLKDLNKMYKSYISTILPEGINVPSKVFLLLRLQCPEGSYDVNIEPAKNEVMFENSGLVLDLFERLCKIGYGEKMDTPQKAKRDSSKKQSDRTLDFDVLLAKKAHPAIVMEQSATSLESPGIEKEAQNPLDIPSEPKQTKILRNMFDIADEELLALEEEKGKEQDTLAQHDMSEEAEDIMDPKVTNPFTLARLHSIVRPSMSWPPEVPTLNVRPDGATSPVVSPEGDRVAPIYTPNAPSLLPSPSPSPERHTPFQNPGPPNRPWKSRQSREDDEEEEGPSPLTSTDAESKRPTLLDNWATSMNSSSPLQQSASTTEVKRSEPIFLPTRPSDRSMGNDVQSKSPSKRPAGLSSGQQSAFRTPFKKGSNPSSSSSAPFDRSASPSVRKPSVQPAEPISPANTPIHMFLGFERPSMPSGNELEEIMDFEHRKRNTIQEHNKRAKQLRTCHAVEENDQIEQSPGTFLSLRPERGEQERIDQEASYGSKFGSRMTEGEYDDIPPQPNSAGYTQNPHRNRQRKAIRNLEERGAENGRQSPDLKNSEIGESEGGTGPLKQQARLSPKDPRAYLIRHIQDRGLEGSTSGQKKMSTAKLPFETIEAGLTTYTFVQVVEVEETGDIEQLSRRTEMLGRIDGYVRDGTISSGLVDRSIPKDVIQELEGRVQELMTAENVA